MNMTNISQRQNEQKNIKRLKAQSQMYSDIKFWMICIVIIGVILPIIVSFLTFALNNDFFSNLLGFEKTDIAYISVFIGICSAIFVEILSNFLKIMKENAAKIQEMFDTSVFKLPWDNIIIGNKPDVGLIFEKSEKYDKKNPNDTVFNNWYTMKAAAFKYPEAIAFCQQQNLHWDSSLRRRVIKDSKKLLSAIILIMLILGMLSDFTFRNFSTNVVSLLLPICLYFYKMITEHSETIEEMDHLKKVNEELIHSITSNNLSTDNFMFQCRQLQTAIYNHRKSARPISNWRHKNSKGYQEKESADRMQQYLDGHQ